MKVCLFSQGFPGSASDAGNAGPGGGDGQKNSPLTGLAEFLSADPLRGPDILWVFCPSSAVPGPYNIALKTREENLCWINVMLPPGMRFSHPSPVANEKESTVRSTSWLSHALSVVFSTFVICGAAVQAAQEMPPFLQSFEGVDADGDGSINMEEASALHVRFFAALDENRDGSLSAVEFLSTRLGPAEFGFGGPRLYDTKEKFFAAWDNNRDKRISKAEFTAGALTGFARADSDGDSRLSKAEFDARL